MPTLKGKIFSGHNGDVAITQYSQYSSLFYLKNKL